MKLEKSNLQYKQWLIPVFRAGLAVNVADVDSEHVDSIYLYPPGTLIPH